MSRYIDAEWVRNRINDTCSLKTISLRNLFHILTVAPGIGIVRCGECKYYYNEDPEQIPTASIMCSHMHPYDFCSYGEREGE